MYARLLKHLFLPVYEEVLRGRVTLSYFDRIEQQQWLPASAVRELQWRRLLALMRHVEEHVPFYRDRMRQAGLTARSIQSPDDLRRLPPLTKNDVRQNQAALVATNLGRTPLFPSATGGSTGEPLRFKYDHVCFERRVAAAARADRWAGWDWGCRQLYIWGGALQAQRPLKALKVSLHNSVRNMRILSCFDFNEQVLAQYVEQLQSFRPDVIVGYTNAVVEFARYCVRQNLTVWSPKGVIVSAESLYAPQRAVIEQVFRCGVFNRYGCREMMNIAAECDRHEGLHINADNIYVEVESDGAPARPGVLGELIVTDLNNYSMPFVRYRIGDTGAFSAKLCSCGRGLPMLDRVEGRVLDVIVTRDGRALPGEFFPHLLKDYAGIDRYQVHQDQEYAITVRIVAGPGFDRSALAAIEGHIRARLGAEVPLSIQLVDEIPRTAGGKLRLTISEAPDRRGTPGRSFNPNAN